MMQSVLKCLPVALVLIVAACGSRGQMMIAPENTPLGTIVPVWIGTTRALDDDGRFSTQRSEEANFARFDVSIPKNRDKGDIAWPPKFSTPDSDRHFLTASANLYPDVKSFRHALSKDLARHKGQATVFIHGYNYNFDESLYRVAQFGHDLSLPGTLVEYAWPSAATALGYVEDRDSALFARNGLEALLDALRDAGAQKITIVAHSMGTSIAMETLRQVAIRGDDDLIARLSGVVLISPDLDVDLFRTQALDIDPLPQPFLIFGSDRDRILRLSAFLTQQPERLGSLTAMEKISDLKVTYLDIGEFAVGSGHFVLGDSPALISLLNGISDVAGAFEADGADRIGLLPGALLSVEKATRIVINPLVVVAKGTAARAD